LSLGLANAAAGLDLGRARAGCFWKHARQAWTIPQDPLHFSVALLRAQQIRLPSGVVEAQPAPDGPCARPFPLPPRPFPPRRPPRPLGRTPRASVATTRDGMGGGVSWRAFAISFLIAVDCHGAGCWGDDVPLSDLCVFPGSLKRAPYGEDFVQHQPHRFLTYLAFICRHNLPFWGTVLVIDADTKSEDMPP
jgi:hypothetical protein